MLIVRQPESPAEIDDFFRLAWAAFEPGSYPDAAIPWRDLLIDWPGFDPGSLRCAFLSGQSGEQMVGGCIVHERVLRLGPSRLRTGCVGGVWTHASHRLKGVASAVLRDATAHAIGRRLAILLLDGIPGFYHRFGYVDVHDITWHAVDLARVLALPPSPYQIRKAARDDAAALLDLYQRHYGRYSGSFERDLATQIHCVRHAGQDDGPWLAIDRERRPRGYLTFSWEFNGAKAGEVGADDESALVALLQHHARVCQAQAVPPTELRWPLPADSPTFHALADLLPIRSEISRRPSSDWMARPASVDELSRALVPLWQARWERSALSWSGRLGFHLGGEDGGRWALELAPGYLAIADGIPEGIPWATLSPGVFTRLLFGQRSVEWAESQPNAHIPDEARGVIAALFPAETAWIAGTDSF